MRMRIIAPLGLALLTVACGETTEQRATTGALGGAAVGAVAGGPVGALVGAGVGAAGGANRETIEQRADTAVGNQTETLAGMARSDQEAVDSLTNDDVRDAQTALKSLGLYDGEIDGLYGWRTIQAVGRYQAQNNLPETRALDDHTIEQLQAAAANSAEKPQRGADQSSTPTRAGG